MSGAGYDLGCSTYHPSGRVFQPEYAEKAVAKDDTVIGIRCTDGVVLGVQKTIESKMLIASTHHRIFTTSKKSGMAIAGLLPDGRQLVNKAREESAGYRRNFGLDIPGKVLSQRIALFAHAYTEYWHLRPFGVTVLLATYDSTEGAQLYMIDPTGDCNRFFAIAAGKSHQPARVELEKLDFGKVTCREATQQIAEIIFKNYDDAKDKDFELELSWICEESKYQHEMVPTEVLAAAKAAGEAAIEEEDESDEEPVDATAAAATS